MKPSNPKDNVGETKAPLWLLSPVAKIKWAMAQFAGQVKYGAWNWRVSGVRVSTYASAIGRHLDAYISGEETDPDDGTDHLGNIMACCAILMDAKAAGKLTDDRPPVVDHRPAVAEAKRVSAALRAKYATAAPRHWTIADSVACATLNAPATQGDTDAAAPCTLPETRTLPPLGGACCETETQDRR